MAKRIFNEAKIENVRKFVRAYGEIAGYVDRVDDLQFQLISSLKLACESEPTFDSVGSILGRLPQRSEIIMRKAAWIAQRQCKSRAFCVGNQLVQQQSELFFSAVINQLEHLGLSPRQVPYQSFQSCLKGLKWSRRVDGVLVDPVAMQITVVKGCSTDQVRQWPSEGDSCESVPSLWNPSPRTSWDTFVPSSFIRGLTYSHFILKSAFPAFTIRTILLVVDPSVTSWAHRGYDVTDLSLGDATEDSIGISDERCIWHAVSQNSDHFSAVPDIASKEWLSKLPVDRATRCRMILEKMWTLQAAADGLAPMSASEISKAVESSYLVNYTADWRRHDIEDCLAVGGFIERPRFERKCYVLTPLGVFEALLSRLQLAPASEFRHETDVGARAFSAIRNQARLLARYSEGEQVIS
jgi:hypothetical protein